MVGLQAPEVRRPRELSRKSTFQASSSAERCLEIDAIKDVLSKLLERAASVKPLPSYKKARSFPERRRRALSSVVISVVCYSYRPLGFSAARPEAGSASQSIARKRPPRFGIEESTLRREGQVVNPASASDLAQGRFESAVAPVWKRSRLPELVPRVHAAKLHLTRCRATRPGLGLRLRMAQSRTVCAFDYHRMSSPDKAWQWWQPLPSGHTHRHC